MTRKSKNTALGVTNPSDLTRPIGKRLYGPTGKSFSYSTFISTCDVPSIMHTDLSQTGPFVRQDMAQRVPYLSDIASKI